MKGAREYARLFNTGQYGRLYLVSGHHARGRTFSIQVLPKDEKARSNGENNLCLNKDAVEVYGIVSGNPGWSETYGWLYQGEWQDDFKRLCMAKTKELEEAEQNNTDWKKEKEEKEQKRIQELLKEY